MRNSLESNNLQKKPIEPFVALFPLWSAFSSIEEAEKVVRANAYYVFCYGIFVFALGFFAGVANIPGGLAVNFTVSILVLVLGLYAHFQHSRLAAILLFCFFILEAIDKLLVGKLNNEITLLLLLVMLLATYRLIRATSFIRTKENVAV